MLSENDILRKKLEECERNADTEREISRNFVSGVAHELRTPVAVLRGSLEALCDGVVYEHDQVNEYHKQMLAESIYLQRLVTDLLEFSRLQSSGFRIEKEPVCISDVISDVCRSIRQIASAKNINIIREDEPLVYIISGDYARLRQMFIVILDNAVKFTDHGGTVTVREKLLEDGSLGIEIADTGCGIAEDQLDDIFVKFHRTVSGQNRNGTGLGLAIAKEIALRHGSEIKVRSRVGEGTVFSFNFAERLSEKEIEIL